MAQEDYDKGRALGQKMQAYAPMVALIMLAIVFVGEYFVDNEFNWLLFGLMGINGSHAIKSTKLKDIDIFSIIGNLILLAGTIILILVVLW